MELHGAESETSGQMSVSDWTRNTKLKNQPSTADTVFLVMHQNSVSETSKTFKSRSQMWFLIEFPLIRITVDTTE